jgi:glycosyltransferase involved in cell wall biosynthesis
MVITISEFARHRIIELLGLDPERVTVAHLGVDADRFQPQRGPREEFVLYPARAWSHKNHARLIEAMQAVRLQRPAMRLVLTGGALDLLGDLPDWVDRLGLVSAETLNDLYRRAGVLAFPSLYEGFGLPPLEAMASGCPVAASSSGSIPEVCGDAAVLFDAMDADSIADGILRALERGTELYAMGIEQARRFGWERCRDAHVAVYREIA